MINQSVRLPDLLSNQKNFITAFEKRLISLLNKDELGAFILVLANSLQDEQLNKLLAKKIAVTFKQLKENANLVAGPDDISVFETLKKTGVTQYKTWQYKQVESWLCTLNSFRSLRPERSSKQDFTSLYQDFNKEAFHFSKPFLRPEVISIEKFEQLDLQIMFQKFPFIPYHLLIVINASQYLPQYLDQKTHQTLWHFINTVSQKIKGFRLAYNSLGAGASVNHLHFHGCIINTLSIEETQWLHNGGNQHYPLAVRCCHSIKESWGIIEQQHQNNQPYNLLYSKDCCYIIPRSPQSKKSNDLKMISWYEASGGFIFDQEETFENIKSTDIQRVLANFSL